MSKRETLVELGFEELAESVSPDLECAIVGIVTDGCNDRVAYDFDLIPAGSEIDEENGVEVEFMNERSALDALVMPILFGSDGKNEYEGAIVGVVNGKLLYDYDAIVECKCRDMIKAHKKAKFLNAIGFWKLFPNKLTYLKYALNDSYDDMYTSAVEDVDYNIIRSIPYYMEGPKIIMYRHLFED